MEESDNASEEHSQSTPSSTCSTLVQLLQEFRANNAALWEQMVISALSWVKEKQELLEERDELLSTLFMTQDLFREFQKESDHHSKEIDSKMKEKEMEVCRLQASQIFHMMEAERVRKHLKEERDQAKKMKLSFDKTVTQINAKWKSRWFARQEVAAELKTLQQDCEKKMSKVIRETAEEIICVRKQLTALVEESQMALKQMQTEYHAKRGGKRGKREKEEREKMEKERAKREETERKERVKRLMRERRDEVEREKRERLRREKKENELREERDRKRKKKKTGQTQTSTLPNMGYLTYI